LKLMFHFRRVKKGCNGSFHEKHQENKGLDGWKEVSI